MACRATLSFESSGSMGLTAGTLRARCRSATHRRDLDLVRTCTDIEDLKSAGEALRESESRISKLNDFRETVIRTAAEGICVCIGVPHFPYVEFFRLERTDDRTDRYTQEEINRLGWYQSLYPDEFAREAARQRMDRMRLGDDLRSEEWEICRKEWNSALRRDLVASRLETEDGIRVWSRCA